jgi:hypothetical protein
VSAQTRFGLYQAIEKTTEPGAGKTASVQEVKNFVSQLGDAIREQNMTQPVLLCLFFQVFYAADKLTVLAVFMRSG